ncbi:MAG: hypothetical protein IID41_11490 [Planctomycetes bacterium]|nr:hypothetical protein [Planctomycetota bacterium]
MSSVRCGEGDSVFLRTDKNRPNIVAFNEGGFNFTEVDLLDVLDWAERNSHLVDMLKRKAVE